MTGGLALNPGKSGEVRATQRWHQLPSAPLRARGAASCSDLPENSKIEVSTCQLAPSITQRNHNVSKVLNAVPKEIRISPVVSNFNIQYSRAGLTLVNKPRRSRTRRPDVQVLVILSHHGPRVRVRAHNKVCAGFPYSAPPLPLLTHSLYTH